MMAASVLVSTELVGSSSSRMGASFRNARANEIMHENSKNLTAQQISQVTAFLSAQ